MLRVHMNSDGVNKFPMTYYEMSFAFFSFEKKKKKQQQQQKPTIIVKSLFKLENISPASSTYADNINQI